MRRTTGMALLVALMIAALALTGCATSSVANGPAADTVTAVGTGIGNAAPDTAAFTVGATFRAKDRVAAQDGASKAAAAIIAAVKALGVDAKEIQTGQVSLNEQFDRTGRTVIGYEAVQTIDVKTKLVDKVGEIIAAATTAGATNVYGPNFSLSDTKAAGIDAIDKAMTDAEARAEAMAKAAGRTLGPVVSITESSSGGAVPYAQSLRAADKAAGSVPIEPGQVESQVQLTVVFSLQ